MRGFNVNLLGGKDLKGVCKKTCKNCVFQIFYFGSLLEFRLLGPLRVIGSSNYSVHMEQEDYTCSWN